jgi:hypothetical protein
VEDKRRRRSRALIALLLALSLHGGAMWWFASVASTSSLPPLAERREDITVTVTFSEERPPDPASPPRVVPPPAAAAPSLPRRLARRPGAEPPSSEPPTSDPPTSDAPGSSTATPPSLASPASPAPPADFPRHAWGSPPAAADAPARPVPLPPGDDRAVPKAPRRQRTPSLLSRVMGAGNTSVFGEQSERQLLAGLTDAPPAPEGAADDKLRAWGSLESQPGDGLSPGRRLARSERGGFVWVDEESGLPMPDGPQPKHTGWGRRFSNTGSNLGVGFDDATRPRPATVDKDDLIPTDDGGYAYTRKGWSAKIFPDGQVRFDDDILSYAPGEAPPLYEQLGIPAADLTSGTFDATDALMRVAGLDPYASAKTCFLDEVEPIRDELRSSWKQARLEEAIVALRARLNDLWADPTHDKAARRRAIFALYDSCNDEDAGATARRLIVSWVRITLPAGSPDAFTRAELKAFERDRSGPVAFLPYGSLDDEDAGSSEG